MIPTTLGSEDVFLLPYPANWLSAPVLTPSLQADSLRSEGGIERRQAYASTLISEFAFTIQLSADDNAEFRVGLQALKNSRVLCPFWPSVQSSESFADPAFTTGLWLIAQADLSEWEVNETGIASEFTTTEGAFRVPLMVGYFAKTPNPDADTSVETECRIDFKESGDADFALVPTETDGVAGPALPTGEIPKIFPLSPNWASGPEAGAATVEISRSQIGFGREPASTFYPQSSSRPLKLGFTAETSDQAAELVSFFSKRQAIVESFWLPGALDECQLTVATDGVSAVLHVDDVEAIGDNDWIAIIKISDDTVQIRKITSRDVGAKTITLNVAPSAHALNSVRIVSAILSRFKKPSLAISFITPSVADAAIAFVEVSTEYADTAGETIGVTQGALPKVAFLYRFTRNYPGGTITDRFTSFDRPVVVGGSETFAKTKDTFIEHGDINDTLDPEKTTVSITSRAFTGNPLLLFLPNQLEGNLYLEILECQPDATGAASSATMRFYGTVSKPQFVGPKIKATVAHILRDLGRSVPRYIEQPNCNYEVFGGPCGKDPTEFTFEAEITAIDGNTITLDLAAVDEFFAFGKVWFGSGSTYQGRSVYNSAASGLSTILTIDRPFADPVSVGDTVTARAGCDKVSTTCKIKFDNHVRFGASEFTPNGNPSLVKVVQNETSGGKK